jgi:hypothetical protein
LSPDDASPEEPGGAAVYAAYVAAQVRGQEERKSSFEQRGLAVITTSGVLVSLLFGLAALLTGAAHYHLPHASRVPILAALLCFVIAAIAAIVTNLPLPYRGVTVDALREKVDGQAEETAADARREVALTELEVLERAKQQNKRKGEALALAIRAEIAAVYFLAVAIAAIVLD